MSPSKAGKEVRCVDAGQTSPAEVMRALSPGWWKGWGDRKPLTDEFRDRDRGFNALSVEVTADGHGTRIFEAVFEDDPFLSRQIRAEAARPGSFYALQPVRRGPGGVGRLTQDVVLPDR